MSGSLEAGPIRRSFKLPAPLNTSDELLDRNVWSPNRRSSRVVANSDLRSNSPRTTHSTSLLGPQLSHGSCSSSPKSGTPTKFEDPLMAMPSFRRNGGSPVVEPSGFSGPLPPSPSFRATLSSSNSFSARRIGIDFRRSVPGGVPQGSGSVPGGSGTEPTGAAGGVGAVRPPQDERGLSENGNSEYGGGPSLYELSLGGSDFGGLDGGDEEGGDGELEADPSVRFVRRHTIIATPNGHSSAAAAATAAAAASAGSSSGRASPVSYQRMAMRSTIAVAGGAAGSGREDDEDFQSRLQQNRGSWRARGNSVGATAHIAAACAGEGLQNKTHAALQQLRGELKSLSMRSLAAGQSGAPTTTATTTTTATFGGAGGGTSNGAGDAAAFTAAAGTSAGGGSGRGPASPILRRRSEGPFQQSAPSSSPSRLSLARGAPLASSPGVGPAAGASVPGEALSPGAGLGHLPQQPSPLRVMHALSQ